MLKSNISDAYVINIQKSKLILDDDLPLDETTTM